ncbi:MAG: hypothetical protein M1834_005828 [Cirrosporium novae-zelandiae]|nr:MAG: hypothetical protein M1834_005828 [Cirrosporium novae-zelandiae]
MTWLTTKLRVLLTRHDVDDLSESFSSITTRSSSVSPITGGGIPPTKQVQAQRPQIYGPDPRARRSARAVHYTNEPSPIRYAPERSKSVRRPDQTYTSRTPMGPGNSFRERVDPRYPEEAGIMMPTPAFQRGTSERKNLRPHMKPALYQPPTQFGLQRGRPPEKAKDPLLTSNAVLQTGREHGSISNHPPAQVQMQALSQILHSNAEPSISHALGQTSNHHGITAIDPPPEKARDPSPASKEAHPTREGHGRTSNSPRRSTDPLLEKAKDPSPPFNGEPSITHALARKTPKRTTTGPQQEKANDRSQVCSAGHQTAQEPGRTFNHHPRNTAPAPATGPPPAKEKTKDHSAVSATNPRIVADFDEHELEK